MRVENSYTEGDIVQVWTTNVMRRQTWREALDDAADRLASTVRQEIENRLGDLGDRHADELAVYWRAEDGTTGDRPVELYRMAAHGRLVLIGESGAGKSVFLDRLSLDLLRKRDRNAEEAVPVIVNLTAWTSDNGGLTEWIISRLTLDYPFLDESLTAALLTEGAILPILDGFDEVNGDETTTEETDADLRRLVWSGLNNARVALVVASRPDEYQKAAGSAGPLASATLARLERLSPHAAAAYLANEAEDEDTWHEALRLDPGRLGLALSSPLMVSLARDLYGRDLSCKRFADREEFPTADAIEQHLLTGFVPSRYRNETSNILRRRGPSWVAGLARAIPEGRTELAWWEFGSSVPLLARMTAFAFPAGLVGAGTGWLAQGAGGAAAAAALLIAVALVISMTSTPQVVRIQRIGVIGRARFAWALLGAGLVGGACVGVLGRPLVLSVGLWTLPFAAATGTLAGSFLTWLARRWELGSAAKTVWTELWLGAGGSFVGGAAVALVFWRFQVPDVGYLEWIGYCCVFGLAFAIPAAAEGAPGHEISTPRGLLSANRLWALAQMAFIGVPFGLVAGTVTGPAEGALIGTAVGLAWGVGTTAWGRWLVLVRGWMVLRGHLPWLVWSFLEDTHEKRIIRRKGSVFEFRHGSLQELLAER
ncbi:NACHT domain-containing protein [Actinomadura hibisca]|uniref:NACHT domain-containing protein n=1 Tax=Actinomadura hibisca TaxID=68565 RepID=UPI00082E3D07|nr:NACHT domain-containing protein [Actinomadura hibisca]